MEALLTLEFWLTPLVGGIISLALGNIYHSFNLSAIAAQRTA